LLIPRQVEIKVEGGLRCLFKRRANQARHSKQQMGEDTIAVKAPTKGLRRPRLS
jgi:hypothetical protein